MRTSGRGVPLILYPLIMLSGIGSGICLYIWFRQYTLFFGIHTLSATTVMISILAGMATGSLIIGRLADKTSRLFVLLIIVEMLIGLYTLLHPFLFNKLTWLFNLINQGIYPGPFGVEILRFFLSFIFLVIPTALMGGLVPVLSKHSVEHFRRPGIILSSVISLLIFGILLGLLFSGFFCIQQFGIRTTLIFAAIIFIINSVLAFVLMKTGYVNAPSRYQPVMVRRVRRIAMKFKKRRNVLETSAKLTRAMLHVHFFQGFMIVSLLIIYFRIPFKYTYITPADFHVVIISIMLIGLLLGSASYRRIAERPINSFLTLASLEILTGFTAIISFIAFGFIAPGMIQKIAGVNQEARFFVSQIMLFAVLLLIPSIIIGLTLPLAGKIYCKRIKKTGVSIGRLGYIFLFGSISGLLITGIILIPLAGLHNAFFLVIFLTLLSGIYLLFRDSRLKRGFRLGYTLLVLAVYAILLSFPIRYNLIKTKSVMKTAGSVSDMQEGFSAWVGILDRTDGNRVVSINGTSYFESGKAGMKIQQLPAILPCLLHKNIQSALVIGFGMGLTASSLDACGVQTIHITDVFPEVVTLSSHVFADLNNDILTGSNVDITIEDARSYLIRSENKFDLITSGSSYPSLLPNLYTTDFYKVCLFRLSENGMLCQILPTDHITVTEFRALLKSCTDIFPHVSLWYLTPERLLMLAEKTKPAIEYCYLVNRFLQLSSNNKFGTMDIHTIKSLFAHLLLNDPMLRSYVIGAPENSDNMPFVEYNRETFRANDPAILRQLMKFTIDYHNLLQTGQNCLFDLQEVIREIVEQNNKIKQQMNKVSQQ